MKDIVIAVITILVIWIGSLYQPADPCGHLTGTDYDWCHLHQMKGA